MKWKWATHMEFKLTARALLAVPHRELLELPQLRIPANFPVVLTAARQSPCGLANTAALSHRLWLLVSQC